MLAQYVGPQLGVIGLINRCRMYKEYEERECSDIVPPTFEDDAIAARMQR